MIKNFNWKKILPHVAAIAIFLMVSIIYCKPALEGKVLAQHDVIGWKGMVQNSIEYNKQYGHYPLWNPNLFAGMPNYQVAISSKSTLLDFTKYLTFGLPKPISFFFLACLCFYLLSQVLSVNIYLGVLGSLIFAFGSYVPVIISAGHETKMLAIAYMPGMLAGLILIYTKRYWIGLFITALFATQEITSNHPQITYYFGIVCGIMTLSYIITWIKQKNFKHLATAFILTVLAMGIGLGNYALTLLTTSEYAEYTMRGGKTIEKVGNELKAANTKGLDKDYAFSYSYEKAELATVMMPNAFGGSSMNRFDENATVISRLTSKGIPENEAVQLATSLPKYWGGLEFTAGPYYFGVLAVLLAIIGFVISKSKHRWWILASTIIITIMACGKYIEGFNTLLFNNLPFYNKFRAHSMSLIIPQLLMSIMAILGLNELIKAYKIGELKKYIKPILYAVGSVFGLLILLYLFMDYGSPIDKEIIAGYTDPKGNSELGRTIVNSLIADRKNMFGADLLRAIGFAAILIALLYAFIKKWLKPIALIVILTIINTVDLLWVDSKYLNEENYQSPIEYEANNFAPSAADEQILKDKDPNFRVYNLSSDHFYESHTSYFHKSIGGYHPAKLRIYQDVIENQLYNNPPNMQVLNMLNTKYFLVPDPKTNQVQLQQNPDALGAAWLVKNIIWVDGPVQEMNKLDSIQPKESAIVDKQFASQINTPFIWDSSATITLNHFNNDTIQYNFNANNPQFAIFSEIYYPKGWNAYLDGKPTPYAKVNYILRGMMLPAGKHTIEFRFEPTSYQKGIQISYISSILLWITLAIALFAFLYKKWKKTN